MTMLSFVTPTNIALALVAMNLLAFAMFGIDKAKAARGHWRTSEDSLLLLALLGGIFGAYAGRRVFRHKTRKQPFSSRLHTIAVIEALAAAFALWWWLKG